MLGSCIIVPNPIVYDVQPAGPHCGSTEIYLDEFEADIVYHLYRDIANYVSSDDGSDLTVNFGIQTIPGEYTIKATRNISESIVCESEMNGSVIIIDLPNIYTLYPQGPHCPGIEMFLNGSDVDVEYTLINSNTGPVGPAVPGNGGVLSFGPIIEEGDYYVVANTEIGDCESDMIGISQIVHQPIPYSMIPDGVVCEPTEIKLEDSEVGVNYQLMHGNNPVDPIVAGTGEEISFGIQTLQGTYTVEATLADNPFCSTLMNNSISIEVTTVYSVIPQGIHCQGVEIKLNGSQSGVDYQLYRDGVAVEPSLHRNIEHK